MLRCPACGRTPVVSTDDAVWCECGECLFVQGEQAAERELRAAREILPGEWFAAPTPILGLYAVSTYEACAP